MRKRVTRRGFIRGGTAAGAIAGISPNFALTGSSQSKGSRPLVLAAGTMSSASGTPNRVRVTARAMELLRDGADPLDAAIAGVNIVEDDPNDLSVGLGGLPNEDGEVELDACVMHGPTRRAGAVAAIKHIKNPSRVARLVMERTDHLMLAGEGALRFAVVHGFKKEELLTEEGRAIWLRWKENMNPRDNWGPGLATPDNGVFGRAAADSGEGAQLLARADAIIANPPMGTISVLAVNGRGDLAGTTSTSGLAFKIAGRAGDSPIIGAGLFVDNDVGAAGSTGRGDECLKISGAHTVVEAMRRGMPPVEACLEAVKRAVRNYDGNMEKLRKFSLIFYALNKQGEYGAAGLWGHWRIDNELRPLRYVVHNGRENRLHEIAYLYESPEK